SLDKRIQVWSMRKYVCGVNEIRSTGMCGSRPKLRMCRDTNCARRFGDIGRGFVACNADTSLSKMSKIVAVVGADIDDERGSVEVELIDHPVCKGLPVCQPARRCRREIRVVLVEDLLRRNIIRHLAQAAVSADHNSQRILQMTLAEEIIRGWLIAQVD